MFFLLKYSVSSPHIMFFNDLLLNRNVKTPQTQTIKARHDPDF